VRAFTDEFEDRLNSTDMRDEPPQTPITVVTGAMFAPVLAGLLERAGLESVLRVLPVANRFFGGNVAVTGLLAGSDIVEAVRESDAGGTVLVPDVIFNDDGLTLDDMSLDDLERRSGHNYHDGPRRRRRPALCYSLELQYVGHVALPRNPSEPIHVASHRCSRRST
jgi:NifB/MoaA-like Fe-S oxidoreductase